MFTSKIGTLQGLTINDDLFHYFIFIACFLKSFINYETKHLSHT